MTRQRECGDRQRKEEGQECSAVQAPVEHLLDDSPAVGSKRRSEYAWPARKRCARRQISCGRVLQPVAVGSKSLADYTHICGRELIAEIRQLSEPLRGHRIVHISATAFGGGVSEILYT